MTINKNRVEEKSAAVVRPTERNEEAPEEIREILNRLKIKKWCSGRRKILLEITYHDSTIGLCCCAVLFSMAL